MEPNLTDELCTRCGLCCDGTLFADVELAGRKEAVALERLGLEIDEDDAERVLLAQPCRALRGTRCTIYAGRPGCCRTFECGLLQAARRGEVGVGEARRQISETLASIERVKGLLVRLRSLNPNLPLRENCAEALAEPLPGTARMRVQLEAALAAVEARISKTFLPRLGRRFGVRRS